MSLTYRIDSQAGMLFVDADDEEITQTQRIESIRAWLNDPSFRPGMNTLCDFSAAETTPNLSDLADVVNFIKSHTEAIGRKKVAIVTGNPLVFGVARQFQSFMTSSALDVSVFTDRGPAIAWLQAEEA